MGLQPPMAELPDEVAFTLDEVGLLLFAVDIAVERALQGGNEHAAATRAQRLITSRLWPGLGSLLDDDEAEGEYVDSVTHTDAQITVPEAARRLGLPGEQVYRMTFHGELIGGPHEDGAVYVSAISVQEYVAHQVTGHAEQR